MGARRNPPTQTPASNTNREIALQTSVGFKNVPSTYYADAARKLQPDIVVGIADIPFGQANVGVKRRDKMAGRTENWTRDLIAARKAMVQEKGADKSFAIFAPFLPIERDLQSWYLEHLVDEMKGDVSGIAVYDAFLLDDLPEELQELPKLSLHAPASPVEVLRQVRLGVDMLVIPFVNEATDAGIALDFTFPAPKKEAEAEGEEKEVPASERRSLGVDMWDATLATSMTPLAEDCGCYACTSHSRAYIQHLLAAKEMLGWVLIQLHNHTVMSSFFAGVRSSIEAGTFEADVAAFEAYYETKLPAKTGQGPRVRGYQFRSDEHAKPGKKNPKPFKKFDADGNPVEPKVYAAHGQQPQSKPEVKDRIDDEALVGIVDVEPVKEELEREINDGKGEVKLEDDAKADKSP